MAAKTADSIDYETRPRAGRRSYVIGDGLTLYVGGFAGVNAAGYLAPWADTVGHEFQGLILDGDRRGGKGIQADGTLHPILGEISDTPPPEARVDCSGVMMLSVPVASAAQANVNSLVYCETDNPADCDLTASVNVAAIAWGHRYVSSGVMDITLFTPEEHLAL